MEENKAQGLSQEELDGQEIAELPTRHAMTLIDTGGGGLGGGLLGGAPSTTPTDTSTVPTTGTGGAGFAQGFAHSPDLSAAQPAPGAAYDPSQSASSAT